MTRAALALATALPLVTALAAPAGETPGPAPGVRAELADLAWIAGDWTGEKQGDLVEESWLPPAAGAMLGAFRWVRGERVVVYELLALEQRPEGVVLVLRHFGPGLAPREEKDGALVFDLVEWRAGEAFFAGRDAEKPTRLGYRRGEGGALVAVLERTRAGETTVEEFVYRRR